jgi:hypothetical protein
MQCEGEERFSCDMPAVGERKVQLSDAVKRRKDGADRKCNVGEKKIRPLNTVSRGKEDSSVISKE